MIVTTEIAPAPQLAPFIKCYTYRSFDTEGASLIKPWHATTEVNIPFFFKALPLHLKDPSTGHVLQTGKYSGICGMADRFIGEMSFNGRYAFFQIIFRPNGFYKIFRMPGKEISNHIFNPEDICHSGIRTLYDQLASSDTIHQMVQLAERWISEELNKQRIVNGTDAISRTSAYIIRQAGLADVVQLASYANMSLRNFERRFAEETGIAAKQFCCITRFSNALQIKLEHPSFNWASIAQQAGYFDQMHLIKDFKKYAGAPPASLIKNVPLLEEHYNSRVTG
ncbi:MAG: AraC family transcriptional regulator [Chitinophagaceae bacterium]